MVSHSFFDLCYHLFAFNILDKYEFTLFPDVFTFGWNSFIYYYCRCL